MGLAIIAMTMIGAADPPSRPVGPAYEGVWYVADSTDNNSGDREVWAFQTHFSDADYVTLRMRCSAGKPTLFVEWADQKFPDQTVVTIGASADADSDPANRQYVFELSKDPVDWGLRASPETSAQIVAAIIDAGYVSLTAYPTSGVRRVGMDIIGARGAWARVYRHCPVRKMATPPK